VNQKVPQIKQSQK